MRAGLTLMCGLGVALFGVPTSSLANAVLVLDSAHLAALSGGVQRFVACLLLPGACRGCGWVIYWLSIAI